MNITLGRRLGDILERQNNSLERIKEAYSQFRKYDLWCRYKGVKRNQMDPRLLSVGFETALNPLNVREKEDLFGITNTPSRMDSNATTKE